MRALLPRGNNIYLDVCFSKFYLYLMSRVNWYMCLKLQIAKVIGEGISVQINERFYF